MANTTSSQSIAQPWETEACHRAQFAACSFFTVFFLLNDISSHKFNIAWILGAFYTAGASARLQRWKQGQVTVAPLLANGTEGSKKQHQKLCIDVAMSCLFLLLGLICCWIILRNDVENLYFRIVMLTGINLFGWYSVQWLREVAPMITQYYVQTNTIRAVATSPSVDTAQPTTATAAPKPVPLRLGNGGKS